jgi:23S rRNA (uracil1939-C5)-methyltransferase
MSKPAPDRTPQQPDTRPKKFDLVEVEVHGLAYGGAGVARRDGFVMFVPHTAPGDLARVKVLKRKASYGEGKLIEVVRPAPERIEPVCPLAGHCGGCAWQHLPYTEQLRWKQQIVADALRPVAQEGIAVEPIVPSPDAFRYRNKMEFTFGTDAASGALIAGFHRPEDWRRILDAERCWLAPEPVERTLRAAVAEAARQGLGAWDPRVHRGMLRQLVVRHSVTENRLIALLLTGERTGLDFAAFAAALRAAEPTVKGIAWGLNSRVSDVARAEEILAGDGELTLEERLGPLSFRISLESFFQSNSRAAAALYGVVRDMAELTGAERLLDAYCGTGTIAQYCAPHCREVHGIELVQEAVWDARENARRNGLANCTFMAGDMREALPRLMGAIEGRFDRVVVDPPRGGMEKKALGQLLGLRAPLFVYVSCNPTTMARDLNDAIAAGYRVERVVPVDMFPQTYHVECVAKLRRG